MSCISAQSHGMGIDDLNGSGAGSLLLHGSLTRNNLREQARVLIRSAIVTGALHEGSVYPVKFFAEHFGVSRTPIREALLDLANRGLVEALPNRGFRVIPSSYKDQDNIARVREMLEVPAMGSLALSITPVVIAQARQLCQHTVLAANQNDLAGFLEADRVFHLFLIEQLGNDQLTRIVAELRERMRLPGIRHLAENAGLVAVGEDHVPLVEALADHNQVQAEGVMRNHLRHLRSDWAGNQPRLAPDSTEEYPG